MSSKNYVLVSVAALSMVLAGAADAKPKHKASKAATPEWSIVIHGGAGVMDRDQMSPQTEAAYRAALARALAAGAEALKAGKPGLDAIEAAISIMEDDPLFNAGRGAVFTAEGKNELDAAIMDGSNLKAGSVAGITTVRHPISAARAVMEKSPHVMLSGRGADAFAAKAGLEIVPPSFFFTERRWIGLEKELKGRGDPVPPRPEGAPAPSEKAAMAPLDEKKFGTVGVVVRDTAGHIAAGTSTGGTTGKRWGRVGDTPIIGSGTYADDKSCAVSATGTGEYFIRLTVAREICALVQYRHLPLQKAADEVVQKRLTALGGDGGIIAVDPKGEMAWSFNTPGMYRAKQSSRSEPVIGIFKDEK